MGGGLGCWQNSAWTHHLLPGDPPNGSVFSVASDVSGRLWVSAGAEDLYRLVEAGFEQVTPVVHGVKAILTDRSGGVWAWVRDGLFHWDGRPPMRFNLQQGLGARGVRALAEDREGWVWAGSEGGTLYRIRHEVVQAFRPGEGAHPIWSLLAEADGTLWVGTFRGGLLRFRDGEFVAYSKVQGLPNMVICQILADDQGNLWLGTQQGVVRVSKVHLSEVALGRLTSLPCMVFGQADGLPSNECSGGYQPAAWKTRTGRLWFSTLKGAASIDPARVEPNRPAPVVSIEQVLVDGVEGWPAHRSGPGWRIVARRPAHQTPRPRSPFLPVAGELKSITPA